MSILSAIGKGLKYVGTAVRTVARYSVGDGCEVITKARKAATPAGTTKISSIFSKDAAKAGWDTLKKDVVKTATSKKGLWASIKSFGKSLITKSQAGWRLARMQAAAAGKTAGFFTKTWGALKGVGKSLKKMPVIGTLLTIGWEIPEVYKAFTNKEGGVWEGIKQIGKSALKIAAGTALSAIGTAFLGPLGGAAGYLIGEWIVGKLTGGDFSDNHPETSETEEDSGDEETQDAADENDESQGTGSTTGAASSQSTVSIPSVSTGIGDIYRQYTPVSMTANITNPFGSINSIYGNGYAGYNTGTSNITGITTTPTGTGTTQNIFDLYPSGYKFQYLG